MQISPSEAWKLDIMEIQALSDDNARDTDLSLMLNFERKRNGAKQQWLEETANGN